MIKYGDLLVETLQDILDGTATPITISDDLTIPFNGLYDDAQSLESWLRIGTNNPTFETINITGSVIITGSGALAIGTIPPLSASSGTGIWLDQNGLTGLNSNVVQAVFDAATGKITAGAGAVFLDSTGITLIDGTVLNGKLNTGSGGDVIYQTQMVNSVVGILEIGNTNNAGYTAPVGYVQYTNPGSTSNLLLTNPGFEVGDTSGWTASGGGSFSASNFYNNVHDGSYGAIALGTGAQTIETASANRANVTAGSSYAFSVWLRSWIFESCTVTATFYDNGGVSKGTTTVFSGSVSSGWFMANMNVVAPAGATKAGIRLSYTGNVKPEGHTFDTASITVAGTTALIQFDTSGNVTINGLVVISAAGGLSLNGADINSGWVADSSAWTQTGSYSFTVSGNVTATYRKGNKIRYKDGGAYKYGVVASAVYGAPNTTITLVTNSDYLMAAATITDRYYSLTENPSGWPAWFNYTGQVDQGVTTNIGKTNTYSKWFSTGNQLVFSFEYSMTGNGTVGNQILILCPVDPINNAFPTVGYGDFYDSSAAADYGALVSFNSSTYLRMRGTSNNLLVGVNPNMAIASGDVVTGEAVYEY